VGIRPARKIFGGGLLFNLRRPDRWRKVNHAPLKGRAAEAQNNICDRADSQRSHEQFPEPMSEFAQPSQGEATIPNCAIDFFEGDIKNIDVNCARRSAEAPLRQAPGRTTLNPK
jgi:hypothetical protein